MTEKWFNHIRIISFDISLGAFCINSGKKRASPRECLIKILITRGQTKHFAFARLPRRELWNRSYHRRMTTPIVSYAGGSKCTLTSFLGPAPSLIHFSPAQKEEEKWAASRDGAKNSIIEMLIDETNQLNWRSAWKSSRAECSSRVEVYYFEVAFHRVIVPRSGNFESMWRCETWLKSRLSANIKTRK